MTNQISVKLNSLNIKTCWWTSYTINIRTAGPTDKKSDILITIDATYLHNYTEIYKYMLSNHLHCHCISVF